MAARVWLLLCLVLGCGTEIRPKALNQPCTRTGQCERGLSCQGGVCLPVPDAGVDGGSDGGS